jgi:hypothetical protein
MAGFLKNLFGGAKEPAPVAPDVDADADAEIDLAFERAHEELRLKSELHQSTWGLDGASWAADLESGTITFVNARGWTITAPVQVIGTFNTLDGTWLWGWGSPSVPEPVSEHAQLVRAFGEKYGLGALTTRMIEASEEDGWEFTALACHLAGAQGGYRGPAGTTMVFMTFGEVTISGD